jgi:biopolymer transport protein TolR
MIGNVQRNNSLKFSRILKRNKTISQINVTPMVDVMLVLLVIFMITAPLLTVGIPINLPKTKAKALPEDQTPLSITINKDEKIFLQDSEIDLENLVPRLIAISKNKSDRKIFIRADKVLSYGEVVKIMGLISSAGFNKIALVTDFPKPKLKPKLKKNK